MPCCRCDSTCDLLAVAFPPEDNQIFIATFCNDCYLLYSQLYPLTVVGEADTDPAAPVTALDAVGEDPC